MKERTFPSDWLNRYLEQTLRSSISVASLLPMQVGLVMVNEQ
jgi:hypothetical protein